MIYKIITLGMYDNFKSKFLKLYNNKNFMKNKLKSKIKEENNIELLNIEVKNNIFKIYNKSTDLYFRESNNEYYSNINALIIFFNSKNKNIIDDLKFIWLKELKENNVKNNIPIFIINYYTKNNNFNKNIYDNILTLTNKYKSINYIPLEVDDKLLTSIIINQIITKILRNKQKNAL